MTVLITSRSPAHGVERTGPILGDQTAPVKRAEMKVGTSPVGHSTTLRRRRKQKRRQSHGSAWHWQQTDCWYYTRPGTKQRVPLYDEDGNRIRGSENKQAAQLALARVKLGQGWRPEAPPRIARRVDRGTEVFGPVGEWGVLVADLRGEKNAMLHKFVGNRGAKSWRVSHPHPVFSADGRRIYFNIDAGQHTQLYVAELTS